MVNLHLADFLLNATRNFYPHLLAAKVPNKCHLDEWIGNVNNIYQVFCEWIADILQKKGNIGNT